MANTEKTLNWSFPFTTAGVRSREVVDPQTCYDALAKARGGSYPLGRNGLWHGGVHFDRETATTLDQTTVRCVADGEVIAYRIDATYPTALQRDGKQVAYSTGFVLIKHCLSLPHEQNSSLTLAPPPSLTFYSLYMHLLSWEHYQQEPDKPRPAFWGGEPEGIGRVVVLNRPVAINATALIGHPGVFHTANDVEGGGLLHLEIFSCDDVPAFLDTCRVYASRLLESERTLVSISKIASALVPHTPQINANNPPTMMMPRVRALPGFILPRAVLDNLPFDHRLSNTITHPGQRPFTIRWWHLKQRLADATGQRVSGWLAENTLFFDYYSPWDWAGFDCLRESTCHNEQLACHFQAVGLLSKTRETEYAALINKAIQGPIKTRLRRIIQGTAETIATHPLLTPELIRKALDNPHHAQAISQLIIHYESEWFWNPAKWNELDPLLGHSESDPNEIWTEEKKRIQKLAWWGELAGKHGINGDGKAWHFHPIGLLANFVHIENENDLKWLKVENGQLTFDVEGNDIEDPSHPLHIYFSRKVHWPGGASGITIGRGYDLGQQADAETDLENADIPAPLYSWLIGAKGLKGQAARSYLKQANPEIRIFSISRQQQYKLFTPVYERTKKDVIRISDQHFNKQTYGTLNWESTHKKIQDLIIDLTYRGDYHTRSRPIIQKYFVENNLPKISEAMNTASNWPNVPPDRFKRRINHLRQPL